MTEEPNLLVSVVADVLLQHTRYDIKGCHCGWAELGKSHALHVAKVLDAAGLLTAGRAGSKPPPDVSWVQTETIREGGRR